MNSKAQVNMVLVGAIAVLVVAVGALSFVFLLQSPQAPLPQTPLELCSAQGCSGTIEADNKNYSCRIDRQGQCRAQEMLDGQGNQPVCGNGQLETGEECENDSQCSATQECSACKCLEILENGEEPDEEETSVGLTPLTDFSEVETYMGFEGGLYPNAQNSPPSDYLAFGLEKSSEIQPLDSAGNPLESGKIVLLSIGLSNTTQEFSTFIENFSSSGLNSDLVLVDGARGAVDAQAMSGNGSTSTQKNQFDVYWDDHVPKRLDTASVTPEQVQVVWFKTALVSPGLNPQTENFPDDAKVLQGYMADIIGILEEEFPNLKAVYVSSRIYAGCAKTDLNPEPYAYQSGFAVKWLVEDYINEFSDGTNDLFVAWGPYLWADGTNPRSDGLTWACSDFREDDRTHPGDKAMEKVAEQLHDFFSNDSTTKDWYLG